MDQEAGMNISFMLRYVVEEDVDFHIINFLAKLEAMTLSESETVPQTNDFVEVMPKKRNPSSPPDKRALHTPRKAVQKPMWPRGTRHG